MAATIPAVQHDGCATERPSAFCDQKGNESKRIVTQIDLTYLSTELDQVHRRGEGRAFGNPVVPLSACDAQRLLCLAALREDGERVSEKLVARLMRGDGIRGRVPKRFTLTMAAQATPGPAPVMPADGEMTRRPRPQIPPSAAAAGK